jgi:DNA-binding Lrp family transcriptional regulator
MSTDPLLQVLRHKARFTDQELSDLLSLTPETVGEKIATWEKEGTILGYHAVVDAERAGDTSVSAFIEVKVTPERGGGFDRLALRISRFDQVVSCYLASGGYDLMVVVESEDLREVARFVSEKLSTLEGVLSTATHFRLKTYKENGFLFEGEASTERLAVSP